MPRLLVFLGLIICGVGFSLFQIKYRVIALEQELYAAREKIIEIEHSIHILKAEWEHLNQPQRLQELAENHLDVKPFEKEQYLASSSFTKEGDSFIESIEKVVNEDVKKETLGKPILVQYVPVSMHR